MTTLNSSSLRNRLKYVTLTGIDDAVPVETLLELTRNHPYVEFGVLYNSTLQGNGRFPLLGSINRLVETARHEPKLNLALHICGADVYSLLDNDLESHARALAEYFPRIQLNLRSGTYPLEGVRALHKRYTDKTFIIRYSSDSQYAGASVDSHVTLFDKPEELEQTGFSMKEAISGASKALTGSLMTPLFGFNGELDPAKLITQLREIERITAGDDFWIAIESCLSDPNGAFDVGLAQKALAAVEQALFNDDRLRTPEIRSNPAVDLSRHAFIPSANPKFA